MIVTAWNNGAHNRSGSGYGFKVKNPDRDDFFKPEWEVVLLEIEGEAQAAVVTIDKDGFWSEAGLELACDELGRWLRKNGLAPWPRGNPPVFILDPAGDNRFRVKKASKRPSSAR